MIISIRYILLLITCCVFCNQRTVVVHAFHHPTSYYPTRHVISERSWDHKSTTPAIISHPYYRRCINNKNKNNIISSSSLSTRTSTTRLMFMGSDGGVLGIGGPELATILLVGYFVLGPSDLYKLVKEIGVFIQNIRTLGTDITKTFETNMNDVVQIEELRKAQRELNDAFSFRRTINVDKESDAFTFQAGSAQMNEYENDMMNENNNVIMSTGTDGAATMALPIAGTGTATAVKRKVRRRVLKKPEPIISNNIPDLEMPMMDTTYNKYPNIDDNDDITLSNTYSPEEMAKIDKEFDQYTLDNDYDYNIMSSPKEEIHANDDIKSSSTSSSIQSSASPATSTTMNPMEATAAQNRFQQQMSGNWNEQVIKNEDKLEPISFIMNQIALLEKEKIATIKRLEDEYKQRQEIEMEFYERQRKLLDENAIKVQKELTFGDSLTSSFTKNSKNI